MENQENQDTVTQNQENQDTITQNQENQDTVTQNQDTVTQKQENQDTVTQNQDTVTQNQENQDSVTQSADEAPPSVGDAEGTEAVRAVKDTPSPAGSPPGVSELSSSLAPGVSADLSSSLAPGVSDDLSSSLAPGVSELSCLAPGVSADLSSSLSPGVSADLSCLAPGVSELSCLAPGVSELSCLAPDVADELSRQLQDILNTYCLEDSSEDGAPIPNGQSHGPELNGLASEREDSKPGEVKVNGGGKGGAEKEQKKMQDKKKVKGLGKEITLLMQTLNTLSTPEEKLAGLCKMYAELLEDQRAAQKQMRALQNKQKQLLQEKDVLRTEHSKAVLARSKLESLCRELQRHNRSLKEDGVQRARVEEEKRKEVTCHFQVTLNDIQAQMEQHNERNAGLRQENAQLADKLKKLLQQYELREEHIDKVFKHKDVQQQLVDAKLNQAQEMLKESEERHHREKDFLLKEAVESQRMCELMKQQEVHLKQQLSLYTEKFEEFQSTLSKSNEVFTTFKQEMDKMTKKIKKLEKETVMYRSRWESSNKALLDMAEEKTMRDRECDSLQGKVQRLEKLCRALQQERNQLSKRVQEPCPDAPGSPAPPADSQEPCPDAPGSPAPPADSQEPCPPPDSPPGPSSPGPHACHCGPELDCESQACSLPLAAQE